VDPGDDPGQQQTYADDCQPEESFDEEPAAEAEQGEDEEQGGECHRSAFLASLGHEEGPGCEPPGLIVFEW
jgi:hypothetical protein